jgi:hypothetical protein
VATETAAGRSDAEAGPVTHRRLHSVIVALPVATRRRE